MSNFVRTTNDATTALNRQPVLDCFHRIVLTRHVWNIAAVGGTTRACMLLSCNFFLYSRDISLLDLRARADCEEDHRRADGTSMRSTASPRHCRRPGSPTTYHLAGCTVLHHIAIHSRRSGGSATIVCCVVGRVNQREESLLILHELDRPTVCSTPSNKRFALSGRLYFYLLLPHDAMLARNMPSSTRCFRPSVRPSVKVKSRCSSEMAKRGITR